MPSLEKILLATRFTTSSPKTEFLPRRVGLGYQLTVVDTGRSVIKPMLKAIRKREKLLVQEMPPEDSSEEISRMAHIAKKARK